ncbi:hypothetical protein [Agrococcus jejuensis]|uniref:Uncharacterized protein n=1 Tax=Agrococcus jejuensis TaxID=399736 RepID=A0A1G8FBN0_9MICO|nr:hypothetical protein [Agrococcus jejuensis]SDH79505.1 hypothetical protein SAMN04489720_2414 [Agrococcus jejuensis]
MHPATADACARAHAHRLVLGAVQPAIDAATMALLDVIDDERVTALAAMHPDETPSVVDATIASAYAALGIDLAPMTFQEAVAIVARELLREHLAGVRSLASIATWVPEVVDLEDPGALGPLLRLSYALETASLESRRIDARGAVDAVLAATTDVVTRWRPASLG